MEFRGKHHKVWRDTCLSCVKEFSADNTLGSFCQIRISADQSGTFSSQFQKNRREMPCSGLRVETSHFLSTGIAKEFKWKIEQGFSGCGSTRDHGGMARIKYRCDQVGNKGRGLWRVFRGLDDRAVSGRDRGDQGA